MKNMLYLIVLVFVVKKKDGSFKYAPSCLTLNGELF